MFFVVARLSVSQITTGTILGAIKDSSGGTVANATVQAKAVATNQTREIKTDQDGAYILTNLPIGEYELSVSAPGFRTEVNKGITLQVAQRALLDVVLQPGTVTESIDITTTVPVINTEDAVFGDVIENKRVVELPLNGRNFNGLALLTPNIQDGIPGGATLQNFLAGGIAIWANGQRDTDNEWNLDGATMNIGFYNWNSFNPSIDAIEEFKMQTGTYTADFGFQAGANVNIITKSGTNSAHGTLYDFLRNDAMDARGFFPTSKPELRQNQFGGTVGGPVYIPKLYNGKNRTFFFSNYEGLRIHQQQFGRYTLSTDAQRSGNFSQTATGAPFTGTIVDPTSGAPYAGNIIPASQITVQSQNILKFMPHINTPGTVFNYQILAPVPTISDSTIQRLDHRFSDKDSIFARGAYDNRDRPAAAFFPGFGQDTTLKAYNIVLAHTHIWTPTIIQETRFAFNRSFITQSDPRMYTNFSIQSQLGIPNIPAAGKTDGFPYIAIDGYSPFGDATNFPLIQPDQVWQLASNLTLNRRNHNIKMGFDGRLDRSDRTQGITVRGQFNFSDTNPVGSHNALADFLLGLPTSTALGNQAWTIRMRDIRAALFVQDDWRVSAKVTLNVGLRWEPSTPVHDARGEVAGFDFASFQPVPLTAGQDFYPQDWKLFAPRFGIAWRPFSSDKTVIRAGYGIYYNYTMNLALTKLGSNPPWAIITNYFAAVGSPAITWNNPFPASVAGAPAPPNYGALTNNFRPGYSQVRSIHLAQEISKNDAIELGYVGNFALGGDRSVDANDAPPGPGPIQSRRPHPQYGAVTEVRSDSKTFYNAGTVKYTRRFSGGLSVLGSYTFSRSIDQSFSSVAGNPSGEATSQCYCNLSQRGLSASDRRHVLTVSAMYELPFGKGKPFLNTGGPIGMVLGDWQLSTITTAQSGGPLGIQVLGGTTRLNSGNEQRPDRLRDGNLPADKRSINEWFDTSAFYAPPMYTFGTEETRTIIMPGLATVDLSLKKAFPIKEHARLEFRAEFFNAFNRNNFLAPGNTIGSPSYGIISSANPSRIGQMSLKLVF